MLKEYLFRAISDIREVIDITKMDIEDIKEARHEPQFQRLALKDEKLLSFENNKTLIDKEILNLVEKNPSIELTNLLDEEEHNYLDILKDELNTLKDINKNYARMVLTVSSLFNSFLERIVPTEMQGYNKVTSKDATLLKIKV